MFVLFLSLHESTQSRLLIRAGNEGRFVGGRGRPPGRGQLMGSMQSQHWLCEGLPDTYVQTNSGPLAESAVLCYFLCERAWLFGVVPTVAT